MSELDHEATASELLPCLWAALGGHPYSVERNRPCECLNCSNRPAVADALAAVEAKGAAEIETLRMQLKDFQKQIEIQGSSNIEYLQEIAQLRAERDHWKSNYEQSPAVQSAIKRFHLRLDLNGELAQLRAERDAVESRFPCDHRVVDWDNGHGDCVACQNQTASFDYDRLPHDVIACHDRIEELEADLAVARRELDRRAYLKGADDMMKRLINDSKGGIKTEKK